RARGAAPGAAGTATQLLEQGFLLVGQDRLDLAVHLLLQLLEPLALRGGELELLLQRPGHDLARLGPGRAAEPAPRRPPEPAARSAEPDPGRRAVTFALARQLGRHRLDALLDDLPRRQRPSKGAAGGAAEPEPARRPFLPRLDRRRLPGERLLDHLLDGVEVLQ